MTFLIEWRAEARADLAGIVGFIAQDSPSAAQRMKSQIEPTRRLAAEHPYLFRIGRAPGTREIIVHPNYMIVYRLLAASIEIVNVIHTRRQYP